MQQHLHHAATSVQYTVHYCLPNCWAGDRIHLDSCLWGHQTDISVCTRDRNKLRKAARHCKSGLRLGLQSQEYKFSKHVRTCYVWNHSNTSATVNQTVCATKQQMMHQAIALLKSNGNESVCQWPTSQMVGRFLAHCRQLPQLRIKGTATRSPTWPFGQMPHFGGCDAQHFQNFSYFRWISFKKYGIIYNI